MSTTTLTAPIRVNTAGVHARPGLGRLVAVELRKMVDTRAGFWLQVAMVALTVVVVVVRLLVGDAAHHTFQSVLNVGLQPAAVLLAVVGILLVTSEWSQRTGLITFALVPVRSRVLAAKLLASLVLRHRGGGRVPGHRRRRSAARGSRRRRDVVGRRGDGWPVGGLRDRLDRHRRRLRRHPARLGAGDRRQLRTADGMGRARLDPRLRERRPHGWTPASTGCPGTSSAAPNGRTRAPRSPSGWCSRS